MPTVGWYKFRKGHRTIFSFYGPIQDVEAVVAMFRELLLTIASIAKLLWGGHARKSAAEFAEGYVKKLFEAAENELGQASQIGPNSGSANKSLVLARALQIKDAGREWLKAECGISLRGRRRQPRSFSDPRARELGRQYGSNHKLDIPNVPKRIEHRK